jgi:hypothetical protein
MYFCSFLSMEECVGGHNNANKHPCIYIYDGEEDRRRSVLFMI